MMKRMWEYGKTGKARGTNNKDVICSMRMDKETKERLDAYCEKMQIAKSEALRQAIQMLTEEGKGTV